MTTIYVWKVVHMRLSDKVGVCWILEVPHPFRVLRDDDFLIDL